jgi:hypothetical protein
MQRDQRDSHRFGEGGKNAQEDKSRCCPTRLWDDLKKTKEIWERATP